MRLCACGGEIETRRGKFCPECLFAARSRNGKMTTGRKMKGSTKDGSGRHKGTAAGCIEVKAKCPACWKIHMVSILPAMVEAGKLPRLFCPLHVGNRTRTITAYGTGARL